MHEAGDDCMCADGSEYVYFSRAGDPDKVMLYFQGGGACFSAETCSFTDGSYKVTTGPGDHPGDGAGIFDRDHPANPLRDYTVVFVPYCTGDVHIGDATTEYSDELTVAHNGFRNASHGFDHVVANHPDLTHLFVAGSSAGGIPSPLFGGLASDASRTPTSPYSPTPRAATRASPGSTPASAARSGARSTSSPTGPSSRV
jgi:hypothetical protein